MDGGLANHDQLLAGAVDAGIVERLDVVNGRHVIGREVVISSARSKIRLQEWPGDRPLGRLEAEVAEAVNRADNGFERCRYGWLGGVGEVHLAVHQIVMEPGAEGVSIWGAAPLQAIQLRPRATPTTVRPSLCSQAAILATSSWLTPKRSAYSSGVSQWRKSGEDGSCWPASSWVSAVS